jgi:two-component system KDP operon response regulator KdpE
MTPRDLLQIALHLGALLLRHAGQVLTRRQILREVWGPKTEEHREYPRVSFTALRKHLARDRTRPELNQTETGIGYRFRAGD